MIIEFIDSKSRLLMTFPFNSVNLKIDAISYNNNKNNNNNSM